MALLTLEERLSGFRQRLTEAKRRCEAGQCDDAFVKTVLEDFLNALDRLCCCIRMGMIDEAAYRRDYRDNVLAAIQKNPSYSQPPVRYDHILHVHTAWSGDRTAVDRAVSTALARTL